MTDRLIEDEPNRKLLIRFIEGQVLPFSITITAGRRRSIEQNKLQRLWCNEISEQLGDQTPENVRGYCKLAIGVPILRAESEKFRVKYDAVVKPLPYEQKLAIMMEPLDMPITRFMTVRQKSKYLDGVYQHFSEKGLVLTIPDDAGLKADITKTRRAR